MNRPNGRAVHLIGCAFLLAAVMAGCGGDLSIEYGPELVEHAQMLSTGSLPIKIEAEDFINGAEGVAYHDLTPANLGKKYRNTGVDIEATTDVGGGYNVGWIQAGEWLAFNVSAPISGTYPLRVRVASGVAGNKSLHFEVDGQPIPGATGTFPGGTNWQSWSDVSAGSVKLSSGNHTLKLVFDSDKLNVNYIQVSQPSMETLFGAAFSTNTDQRYDEMVQMLGGMQVHRSFDNGQGVASYLNTYQPQDVAHNAASAFSFKYLPSEVLSGQHDAAFNDFFNGIADNHIVFWTYWHEPDDELYKNHVFTPTDYRAAWAHIKSIANRVKANRPKLQIYATLIIMEYSMTAPIAPSRPLLGDNGMYPGDDVIDVFGADCYNEAAKSGGISNVANIYGKIIAFAQSHNKQWAVPEIGSLDVPGNPNGRAQFLSNSISYWKNSNYPPIYATYFDTTVGGDFMFDNDPAALKVWKNAMIYGLSAF